MNCYAESLHNLPYREDRGGKTCRLPFPTAIVRSGKYADSSCGSYRHFDGVRAISAMPPTATEKYGSQRGEETMPTLRCCETPWTR